MRLFVVGVALLIASVAGAEQPYRVVKSVKLGGEGGWDYVTVDAVARRLYIPRGTRVMVLDADSVAVVGEIKDTPGVHGVAIAPDFGRGFTSNGRAGTATIFDLKTLEVLGQPKTGDNPDAIFYEPVSRRVFTFNGRSGDATAIDAKSGTVAGTVPLGGKPEAAASDGTGRVFVNIEDKAELVGFDAGDLKVKSRWPLTGCEEPTGLAFDRETKRLFSVCHNKAMLVVDSGSGRIVATLPIGANVDGAAFDPATQTVFSSNGDGTLTIVKERSADSFEVVQTLETRRGARTLALDPKTHDIILVTAEFAAAPAPTPEQPRPRPSLVPDSFMVLVVGR